MTYPIELREQTPPWDSSYPIRFYRNKGESLRKDECILGLHWHEHFELIDMIRGHGVFHIDSRPYEAEPGDLLLVPKGGLHVGYAMEDGPVEYIAAVFNASLLRLPYADPVHERYMAPVLDGRVRLPVKFPVSDEATDSYRRHIREATHEFEKQSPAYQLLVKHHLELLFTLLAREYLPSKLLDTPAVNRNHETFKPLLERIAESGQGKEPLSMKEAARMVNLSPYHFCKTFKKVTGRTYVDFINWSRVNEADLLLRDSGMTVSEIAERIGCGNANYFTKMYVKYKGVSPSQARKSKL
ncbi:helix-turn-helix transcriptional regulator [Paenibacillus gansuensis]|uniref:AraC family transcriptional regulator n=1 Tax=Paenibacillus gansuensis TaxID=306542 RepID=A0ABW5PFN5_9BACL